jgi:hypothetical protein
VVSDVSILVSGPLISRISEGDLLERFCKLQRDIIESDLKIEVIISTYRGEVPIGLEKLVTRIVICEDPGIDKYRSAVWPLGTKSRNTTRMLHSTNAGLEVINSQFTIKTRAELIPNDTKVLFNLIKNSKFLESKDNDSHAIFIYEHFFGVNGGNKGVLFWIPDTFQIMKTIAMKTLWLSAQRNWILYQKVWHQNKIKYPLTNEQILGTSYYRLDNFSGKKIRIGDLHRYSFNKAIFSECLKSEFSDFILVPFNELRLTESRLTKKISHRPTEYKKLDVEGHGRSATRLLVFFLMKRLWIKYSLPLVKIIEMMKCKVRFLYRAFANVTRSKILGR